MRLYLVRHGETTWNLQSRFQGWSDNPLSPRGEEQARELAEQLHSVPFDAAYSSGLIRARRTAEIVLQGRDLDITPIDELREHGIGDLDGLTEVEIRGKYPGILETMRDDPTHFRPPNGETLQEVQDRCWPHLMRIAEKHQGENVILVAHHSVNKSLLCKMLNMPLTSFKILRQPPCTVSILEIRGDLRYVHAINLNWRERVSPWHDLSDSVKDRVRDPRAVIFDMDGVLINSMPLYAAAWRSALARHGVFPPEIEFYRRESEDWRESVKHFFGVAGIDLDDERGLAVMEEVYGAFNSYPKPAAMPGAFELAKALKNSGRKIAIVSGSPRNSLASKLSEEEMGLFDAIVTGTDVERGKPHPDPYLSALEKLDVDPGETIAVENAPFGIRSARSAGLFTIAITSTLPREDLAEADLVIDGLSRLTGWIEM